MEGPHAFDNMGQKKVAKWFVVEEISELHSPPSVVRSLGRVKTYIYIIYAWPAVTFHCQNMALRHKRLRTTDLRLYEIWLLRMSLHME